MLLYFKSFIRESAIVYIVTSIVSFFFCVDKVQRAYHLSFTHFAFLYLYKNNHFHSRFSFTATTSRGKHILINDVGIVCIKSTSILYR